MAIQLHTDVTEVPEQLELTQGRARDDFQKQIDTEVANLKRNTASKGWPKHDPRYLFGRYVVGKTDVSALKAVIRRAGTLHKVEARFYKDATTEAGHIVVKFHLERKTDKDGKFVKDDSLNADGTPKKPAAAK